MSLPDPGEVPPREAIKVILGDNAQTDLLLLLHGDRKTLSARDLRRELDYDVDTIAAEVNNLARVNAITSPNPGQYRLAYSPVGRRLHDLIDVMAEEDRKRAGYTPLEDCL